MIIFLWIKGFYMNKGFLVLALFGISLFLLVSSVSAEDIGSYFYWYLQLVLKI